MLVSMTMSSRRRERSRIRRAFDRIERIEFAAEFIEQGRDFHIENGVRSSLSLHVAMETIAGEIEEQPFSRKSVEAVRRNARHLIASTISSGRPGSQSCDGPWKVMFVGHTPRKRAPRHLTALEDPIDVSSQKPVRSASSDRRKSRTAAMNVGLASAFPKFRRIHARQVHQTAQAPFGICQKSQGLEGERLGVVGGRPGRIVKGALRVEP